MFRYVADDQLLEAFAQVCMRHMDFDDWLAKHDENFQANRFPSVVQWDVTAFDKFFRDHRRRHPGKTRQECVLDLVAHGFTDSPVSSSVFRRCFMVGSVESTEAAGVLQQTGQPLLSLAACQLGLRVGRYEFSSQRDPETERWQVLVEDMIRCKSDLHASEWVALRAQGSPPLVAARGRVLGEAVLSKPRCLHVMVMSPLFSSWMNEPRCCDSTSDAGGSGCGVDMLLGDSSSSNPHLPARELLRPRIGSIQQRQPLTCFYLTLLV